MSTSIHSLAIEVVWKIGAEVASCPDGDQLYSSPPSDLAALRSTSRGFFNALDQDAFLATLFTRTFDYAALHRRIPPEQRTASVLATEYKRRWRVLQRIRKRSQHDLGWRPRDYVRVIMREDLMTMYLMLIESDGKNAALLLRYAQITRYLDTYERSVLQPVHETPEMPQESEETSLFLWLVWLTFDYFGGIFRTQHEQFVHLEWLLTPYVLGGFKYAHTWGPWVYPALPGRIVSSTTSSPSTQLPASSPNDPLVPWNSFDARPACTGIPGGYFSTQIAMPMPHHAAVQIQLAASGIRPPRPSSTEPLLPSASDEIPSDQQLLEQASAQGLFPSASTIRNNLSPFKSSDAFTPNYMRVVLPSIANSRRWDGEWTRLVACRDPSAPRRPLAYTYTAGSMTGEWDGRTLIGPHDDLVRLQNAIASTDEDAEFPLNIIEDTYKLYDSQSWSIVEYHYRPYTKGQPLRYGHVMNAHLPQNVMYEHKAMWDPQAAKWKNGILISEGRGVAPAFYEAVSTSAPAPVPTFNPHGTYVPIIILGHATAPPAHSPSLPRTMGPGSTVIGTVRPWDGLVTLRARSPLHGSFLYTGYLIGGGLGPRMEERGNWVGRWRDTVAELGKLAWEGVFCMRKRPSVPSPQTAPSV